jgi:hypothetical protein
LAILVLANGDMLELKRLVDAANKDWRDILYWAEYPEAVLHRVSIVLRVGTALRLPR